MTSIWTQLGNNIINGTNPGDKSGISISLNDEGNIIAIGSPNHDGNKGQTKIYQLDEDGSNNWILTSGGEIDGLISGDKSGTSVAINGLGDIVVIGEPEADTDIGQVRVFHFESGSWTQLAQTLTFEKQDKNGTSVSINEQGNIIAIGSIYRLGEIPSTLGNVNIYKINTSSTSWELLGTSPIVGDSKDNISISLNGSGDIIAIGSPEVSRVRIYQLSVGTNSWEQMTGGQIFGDISFGTSVSLNGDGTILAVGAPNYQTQTGRVTIYEFASEGVVGWKILGSNSVIDGDAILEKSGYSVSLNKQGDILAIGAPLSSDLTEAGGRVRVYEYDSVMDFWTKLENDINGTDEEGLSGTSVSLNARGNRVAIGIPDSTNGSTQILEYPLPLIPPPSVPTDPPLDGNTSVLSDEENNSPESLQIPRINIYYLFLVIISLLFLFLLFTIYATQ